MRRYKLGRNQDPRPLQQPLSGEAGLFHEQPDTAEQNEPTHKPAKHLGVESPDHPSPSHEPITTSGKVRRAACVEQYRHGQFARLDP